MSDLAITGIFIVLVAIFTVGYNYVITKLRREKMTDENIKEILACIIKHIRPDGEFYPFTNNEVEKMKKLLGSDDNKKEINHEV